MPRVLHCYSGNLYGGIEAMLVTLARCRALAPGLEPHFALCYEGRLADELRAAGARVHPLPPARLSLPWAVLAARRALRRALAEARPDVVVCHAPWSHALFAPTARRAGRPLAFWQHDFAGAGDWPERLASRTRPDLVVANSRSTVATSPRLFPGVRAEVVYCPVAAPEPPIDRAAARAELRDELGTPADARVVIQASRLERWKGHVSLLEALGRLRDRPDWVAWFAGGAQRPHEKIYFDELRAGAESLGIAHRVRFLGQRNDVPRLMAAADIHCQPNTGPEPFGIGYVEALYAGLPVVGTRMGGAAEIVTDECGILVPPGDVGALADALGRLVDDDGLRERLGSAAPARALALCDPAAVLGRLDGLLGELTARRRVPA